eukprot:TRINITY_DN8011_c0_g1_i2.p1 TRINITY_DN8011_c0_g1~~TRINITY_DN8011_c0_g1_i2.p1  ORF type:complete len:808 (-),score=225.46 TRINITY_DN8011_c0_g1_i2:34-2397(-)
MQEKGRTSLSRVRPPPEISRDFEEVEIDELCADDLSDDPSMGLDVDLTRGVPDSAIGTDDNVDYASTDMTQDTEEEQTTDQTDADDATSHETSQTAPEMAVPPHPIISGVIQPPRRKRRRTRLRVGSVMGRDRKPRKQDPLSLMKTKGPTFSGRVLFLLSVLGCAVGTGNIWRFPRIAAMNGGSSGCGFFIIIWACFLFLWAFPLNISEYALGRRTRKGIVQTFSYFLSPKFRPMGIFVAVVSFGITCYYAVISGWCVYFAVYYTINPLPSSYEESSDTFDTFTSSGLAILFHLFVLAGCGAALRWGVKSIERTNIVIVPCLLVIVLTCFIRMLFLGGALEGVAYLFTPDPESLKNPRIFMDGLSQMSFDTGAGTGDFLTYATYIPHFQSVVRAGMITPVLNNIVSLVSGMTTFGTTFAILNGKGYSKEEILDVLQHSGPAGSGMTFEWYPLLFSHMSLGGVLCVAFFVGLSFASFSSLIAMMEVAVRTITDAKISRPKALALVLGVAFLIGIPSDLSTQFLANQDYVWGGALLFSGLFEAFVVIRYGAKRFRTSIINIFHRKIEKLGKWYDIMINYAIPVESVVLFMWWMIGSIVEDETWWNPFAEESLMTFVLQVGLVSILIFLGDRMYVKYFLRPKIPQPIAPTMDSPSGSAIDVERGDEMENPVQDVSTSAIDLVERGENVDDDMEVDGDNVDGMDEEGGKEEKRVDEEEEDEEEAAGNIVHGHSRDREKGIRGQAAESMGDDEETEDAEIRRFGRRIVKHHHQGALRPQDSGNLADSERSDF